MALSNEKKLTIDNQDGEHQSDVARMPNNQSEKSGNSTRGDGLSKTTAFSAAAMETYGTLLHDALQDLHDGSEKLFTALGDLERQEELALNEILIKTAEQVQLSEHLQNNRDNALNAISALNGEFGHCN